MSYSLRQHLFNLAIATDQWINTLFGGSPDETLSARAYRKQPYSFFWLAVDMTLNFIFFWEEDHCKASYNSELERKHLPEGYRDGRAT